MFKVSQSDSGKAWEYGLSRQFADVYKCPINVNSALNKAQAAYNLLSQAERNRIDHAANEATCFLLSADKRLSSTYQIDVQADMVGRKGDVRDILITTKNSVIGISAKHRHNALKHSRLSDSIDFGLEWYGIPCSSDYWNAVSPIFDDLKTRKSRNMKWADLQMKSQNYYKPILQAFVQEVRQNGDVSKMMEYILGKYDYYKIVKENGIVSIQSFNLYGNNEWGSRLAFPTKIQSFQIDHRRDGFATLFADKGWQVSFRIHNAESKIMPSLKFDIQLIGNPNKLTRNEFPYEWH